jgi:hypothetical protein
MTSLYANISRNDYRRLQFNKNTVCELKNICRERKIKGHSRKSKSEIIELIIKDPTHCAWCEHQECICCPECGGVDCVCEQEEQEEQEE